MTETTLPQTELATQIEYIQKQIVNLEEQWLRANTLYRVIYRTQIAGWQLQLRVAIQEMSPVLSQQQRTCNGSERVAALGSSACPVCGRVFETVEWSSQGAVIPRH